METIPAGLIPVEERAAVLAWLPAAFRVRFELLSDVGKAMFWENMGRYAIVSVLSNESLGDFRYRSAGGSMSMLEWEYGGLFSKEVVNGDGNFGGPLELPMRQIFDVMWREPLRSSLLALPNTARPLFRDGIPFPELEGLHSLDEWREYWRPQMWKEGIIGGQPTKNWYPEWFLLENDAGSDENLLRMSCAFREHFWSAVAYATTEHYAAGYVGAHRTYLLDRKAQRVEWVRFDQPFERNYNGLPVPPRWAIEAVDFAEKQRVLREQATS